MQLQPEGLGAWGVVVALAGGAMRGSIPYMFVSLGECLTEKSGKINLGMEGVLLMGAVTAFGVSDVTGSPWLGLLAAAAVGLLLGAIHAWLTQQPAVNDVAAGIAMIIFGSGLAFFFGKRFVAPMAPQLPLVDLGGWSHTGAIQSALRISPLFFIGIAAAFFLNWFFTRTSWGLQVRAAGDDPQAARALGIDVNLVRFIAITIGGALAAIGGAHLTLYFPGIWSEGISGGQGLMAVALVIFAKWSPRRCLAAALLFGGAQALGPSLQSLGITGYYYLFNASPYLLTLAVMIVTCTPSRRLAGMPGAFGQEMNKPGPPHLAARGISKHFGALKALDNVSIEIAPGTFHALLGENGAGKSTIVKCLMGFHHGDTGEVLIDHRSTRIDSPRAARRHGLGMVYQHFTLIPSMTVAENLVLARPRLPFVIDWKAEKKEVAAFLDRAPFRVDLEARVDTLAAGQKQKVEILKELYLETRLLILDEPTSVLTRDEADEVLGFVRRLVDNRELSVLLITHKFREVMAYCDEVTVLRRGRFAGAGKTAALDPSRMAEMMMGEPRNQENVAKSNRRFGQPVLRIEDLRARGDNGLEVLRGVNLTVREGEIVGIAGVSGNGQKELVEVIAGQRPALSGRITVNGENHLPTRAQLRAHQFFTLPEEPLRNAAVARMSVAENMAFGVFDRAPLQRSGFLLDRSAMDGFARKLIARFSVRPPLPDSPIGQLSGGNVQRAILARELASGEVRVLVAANPCFGLDFKAVDFIHDLLVETRNKGAAVLLVSEDLDELLVLADRIFVMTEGIVAHETTPADIDLAVIGRQMAGQH